MSDVNRIKAEALREAVVAVQHVFDLQCPPMPPDKYVDRGAWMAHSWWNTVLGHTLRDLRARVDALDPKTAADMSGDTRGVGG